MREVSVRPSSTQHLATHRSKIPTLDLEIPHLDYTGIKSLIFSMGIGTVGQQTTLTPIEEGLTDEGEGGEEKER